MTTIVYRAKVLACDSRESSDNGETGDFGYIVQDTCKKIFRLPDGRLFGAAHSTEDGDRLLDAMRKGYGAPHLDDVHGIVVNLDGTYELYEGRIWTPCKLPYYALGSGARFALAAMDAGASAKEAAAIGAKRDPYSGGRIQVLKLKGGRRRLRQP